MKNAWLIACLFAATAVILAIRSAVPAHADAVTPVVLSETAGRAAWPMDAQQPTRSKERTTFTGKITQSGYGQFVLEDRSTNYIFLLDDQQRARNFKGQNVKVTGTLDATEPLIHVIDIEGI